MPYIAIHGKAYMQACSIFLFCHLAPKSWSAMGQTSEAGSKLWSCTTLGDGLDQVTRQSLDAEEAALLQELEDCNTKPVAHVKMLTISIYAVYLCYV